MNLSMNNYKMSARDNMVQTIESTRLKTQIIFSNYSKCKLFKNWSQKKKMN